MDKINFIQSYSVKQQYEVRRWFYVSFGSIVLCTATLFIIQIRQIMQWYATKQTYEHHKKILSSFEQLTNKYHSLTKEKQFLEQRIKRITHLHNKTVAHPFFMLAHLQKKYSDIAIESCTVYHKKVKLVVKSVHHSAIQAVIKELRTNALLKDATLSHIHVHKELIYATIEATLHYSPEETKK